MASLGSNRYSQRNPFQARLQPRRLPQRHGAPFAAVALGGVQVEHPAAAAREGRCQDALRQAGAQDHHIGLGAQKLSYGKMGKFT